MRPAVSPMNSSCATAFAASVSAAEGLTQATSMLQDCDCPISSTVFAAGADFSSAFLSGSALASGLVDKVFLYYAPKILAGTGSVPFAAGDGFPRMNDAARVKSIQLHRFGEDFAVEGYLRDPYRE